MESYFIQVLLLVLTIFVVCLFYLWDRRLPANYPPGPRGWPIFGNLFDLIDFKFNPPNQKFVEWSKEFGDIFSIRVGRRRAVVLNHVEVIKEAFLKYQVEFAGRPYFHSANVLTEGGQDIVFSDYNTTWKLHRKLAHAAIRNLATGNREHFTKLIYSVLPRVEKVLAEKGSTPFNPRPIIGLIVYNILASMCFSKQYEFDDPELLKWMEISKDMVDILSSGIAREFFPITRLLPMFGIQKLHNTHKRIVSVVQKELDSHRRTFDPSITRDLVDMLYKVKQEMVDEGNKDIHKMSETRIRQTVQDVFQGGTDTTILSLHWCIAAMTQHQDMQVKIANELDQVIGRDRIPSLDDRKKCPYTEATIFEVLRYSANAPFAVPHSTTCDVQFRGFTIPKNTMIIPNLWSLHQDRRFWKNPEKFDPGHFIDEEGNVKYHHESYIPFSCGRRVCLGEILAKGELFLLFSWLIQHYKFTKAPGMEDVDYTNNDLMPAGRFPREYEVVATKRF